MDFLNSSQTQLQVLLYVMIAMALGAAIGFERELQDKPAGLRTHMLVTGVSALLVGLGDIVVEHFAAGVGGQLVQSDPIRIFEAVITGVSFLGAGTILRHSGAGRVEGLTTAASILFAAAVGFCVGLGQFVLAVGVTILVLFTLRGLGYLQRRLEQRGNN